MADENFGTLEYQIAMCSVALKNVDWSIAGFSRGAGANSDEVMTPIAYAMFKYLVQDIAADKSIWRKFLREALEETIYLDAVRLGEVKL